MLASVSWMCASLLRRWWSLCLFKEGWWVAWRLLQSLEWISSRSRHALESSLDLARYLVEGGFEWPLSWPSPPLILCPRRYARALRPPVPWSGIFLSLAPVVSWRIPPGSSFGEQDNSQNRFQRRCNRQWKPLNCHQESRRRLPSYIIEWSQGHCTVRMACVWRRMCQRDMWTLSSLDRRDEWQSNCSPNIHRRSRSNSILPVSSGFGRWTGEGNGTFFGRV